jgi:uncharacterized protein YuzE
VSGYSAFPPDEPGSSDRRWPNRIRVSYDREADAAYVPVGREVREGEAASQIAGIVGPNGEGELILDFDAEGRFIGVEVLNASRLLRPEDLPG